MSHIPPDSPDLPKDSPPPDPLPAPSQFPHLLPADQLPPMGLNYETPPPNGNAPLLLKLAGIFSLISSGIDLLQIVMSIGMIVFMHFMMASMVAAGAAAPPPAPHAAAPPAAPLPEAPAPAIPPPEAAPGAPAAPFPGIPAAPAAPGRVFVAPGPAAPPPPPPEWLFIAMYGIPGALSLLVIGFKIFGSLKILRGGKRAWGWGLATGIIGCCEWWTFTPCCLMIIVPVAAGIYTIIIHCLPHVRQYQSSTLAYPQNQPLPR